MGNERVERLLIVEDNSSLACTLEWAMSGWATKIETCGTVADATERVQSWRPDFILLDVALPDGDAFDVLRVAAEQDMIPRIIAISGVAQPTHSFELCKLGVRAYLEKPLDLEMLENKVRDVLTNPPDFTHLVRGTVGYRPMQEVEFEVRSLMVEEALARSGGSRRNAAKRLRVSRQMVQQILRRLRAED